ncbi:glycosyltransferase WbsX family protein [Sphingomonas sp. PAMC 26605]|uniref:glycosyltransferase WbsX family protein n=1 Tax=Sphingomonas sp. PAMC 26605 TaxID=1112214 RepID=UPI00026CABA8|nr:glycoside hydrolase family 99-like domain-containing protein [Sphingomonas sp. PAMC 26605]
MATEQSGHDAIDVLAYYFPQFHADPQNSIWHGEAWTEWDLLRAAQPRYPGHQQPKVPAWGELDESDPRNCAREIDLAVDHGITGFIYDWYWYREKPFLNRALEQGFLQAGNTARMKFALMWANHDWLNIFPASADRSPELLAGGALGAEAFDAMTDYIVDRYFRQPNYLRVDGGLYFSIYELGTFLKGLGGIDPAKRALESFRGKVRDAGLGELHLNGVVWGFTVLPSETALSDVNQVIGDLGFSSVTTYAWVHHYEPGTHGFPAGSYAQAADHSYRAWQKYRDQFALPYHPNVSMGWDPTPRTQQDAAYLDRGYPWNAVLEGNTPEAFGRALERAKQFVAGHPAAGRVITINAWNEWTEGSYLLPDTVTGLAYLRQVRDVFGAPVDAMAHDAE